MASGQREDGTRAGIVHQNIQAAPCNDRLRNGAHSIVGRGRVRDQADNVGVIGGRRFQRQRTARGDDDLGAFRGKAQCRGLADAGAAAGDDHDLVVQRRHDGFLVAALGTREETRPLPALRRMRFFRPVRGGLPKA